MLILDLVVQISTDSGERQQRGQTQRPLAGLKAATSIHHEPCSPPRSGRVAAFASEWVAGFVGIRTLAPAGGRTRGRRGSRAGSAVSAPPGHAPNSRGSPSSSRFRALLPSARGPGPGAPGAGARPRFWGCEGSRASISVPAGSPGSLATYACNPGVAGIGPTLTMPGSDTRQLAWPAPERTADRKYPFDCRPSQRRGEGCA